MHHQKVWTVLNVHFDQGYSQGSVSTSWVRQQFILTGFTRKSVHAICHWTDQTDVSVTLRFEAHWKFKAVTGNNVRLISVKFFLSNSLPLSSTCWQSLRSFCWKVFFVAGVWHSFCSSFVAKPSLSDGKPSYFNLINSWIPLYWFFFENGLHKRSYRQILLLHKSLG